MINESLSNGLKYSWEGTELQELEGKNQVLLSAKRTLGISKMCPECEAPCQYSLSDPRTPVPSRQQEGAGTGSGIPPLCQCSTLGNP